MVTRRIVRNVLFAALVTSPIAADEFRVGVATVDITPPIPYRMSGYFSERLSTGVKDPLQAKAVVFSQGDTKAALVFCDLIGISPDVARRTRSVASRATHIPSDNIAICATHSHTGPLYWGALREFMHKRAVKRHGTDKYETVDYGSQLVDMLVELIKQAHSQAASVHLQAGFASESRLAFNRRFHMRDGTVRFNPGQQNPDILQAAGPIDPQVGIIWISSIKDQRTSALAAIVSFALHLDTVGGTEYSADYPKYLEDELRRFHGSELISMFGAGTCGDLNHIDVTIKTRRSANEIGTMLGQTVNETVDQLSPISQPTLAVASRTVTVPMQTFSDERVAQAVQQMALVDQPRRMSFIDRVETYKINAIRMRGGPTLGLEVQVFRISDDVAIVTLPGEVFVDLGLAIKAASPFATTLVIELTNDAPGYIPTKKAFAEGSYETVNSRIASGGGELMVQAAVDLLQGLKP